MSKKDQIKAIAEMHGIRSGKSYADSNMLWYFVDHKNGKGVSDLAIVHEREDAVTLACGFKASYIDQDKNIKRHVKKSISDAEPELRQQAQAFLDEVIPLIIEWENET